MAKSANAKITGDRADALFMDDLLDASESGSKVARDGVITWLDQAFLGRVNDMQKSKRCMIGQRLHEGDPAGHVLASGDWELLKIPQEYDAPKERRVTSIGWTDPRTVEGELMDPIRFPASALELEKRRLGSRGYSAQHQQSPSPADGDILKRAWFRWYQQPDILPQDIIKALGITRIIQGCRIPHKRTKHRPTIPLASRLGVAESRYYGKLGSLQAESRFPDRQSSHYRRTRGNGMRILCRLKVARRHLGKAIVQALRHGTRLPVIEIPVKNDKTSGLMSVAPTVEAGVVYLPENLPWVSDFLESLIAFPTALHDDDVDAFRIALAYAALGGGKTGLLDHMRQKAQRAKAVQAGVT